MIGQGKKVALLGAADGSLIGQRVTIRFAGKRTVATATVGPDGFFSATAPMPPKKVRNTNRARYVAVAGGQSSLNLKLARRLLMRRPVVNGSKVTLTGRVMPPLTRPITKVAVQQQLDCRTRTTVARFRPRPNGTFKVTVDAPAAQAAIYRLATRVRKTARNKKSFATFSLPVPANLRP